MRRWGDGGGEVGRWRGGEGGGAQGCGAGAWACSTPCRRRRSSTSSPRSGEVAGAPPVAAGAPPVLAVAAAACRAFHRWRRCCHAERGVMLCSGCRPTRDTPWPAHRKRSSSSSGSTYAPAGDAGRGQAKSGVAFMLRLTQGARRTVGGRAVRGRMAVQSGPLRVRGTWPCTNFTTQQFSRAWGKSISALSPVRPVHWTSSFSSSSPPRCTSFLGAGGAAVSSTSSSSMGDGPASALELGPTSDRCTLTGGPVDRLESGRFDPAGATTAGAATAGAP